MDGLAPRQPLRSRSARRSRGVALGLRLLAQVGCVRALVRLDVLELAARVALRVELLAAAAAMGGSPGRHGGPPWGQRDHTAAAWASRPQQAPGGARTDHGAATPARSRREPREA